MKGISRVSLGLHARLMAWLLALLLLAWGALWFGTRYNIEATAATGLDQRLESIASLLLHVQVSRDQDADGTQGLVSSIIADLDDALRFEIVSSKGDVLARSEPFPDAARETTAGFADTLIDDERWRVFTLSDEERGLTSRVALNQHAGFAALDALTDTFQRPLLWLLPVFAVLALIAVWRGLAPLRAIEKAIAEQDPQAPEALVIERERVPTDLRPLVDQLDRLMRRLREVLLRQRAFTTGAGHELRTPLAGCRSQLQVAQRSPEPEQRHRALDKAERSLEQMAGLVEQLLLLARADPAAPPPETEPLDLVERVRRGVASRERHAAVAGVSLRVETREDQSPPIEANASLIDTLITNLLDNAIRFSPPQGEVRIELVQRPGDGVQLRVRDQGPGITEEDRAHVFDPFFSSQRGHGGGLGLAIVQAVAQAHGGEAEAQVAEGGGTEIRVSLPLASRERTPEQRST